MKNYVQTGDTIAVTAAAAVSAGGGVLAGAIFGIATADADIGDDVPIKLNGVYDLAKAPSQEWSVGDLIYWDDGNSRCTTVAEDSPLIGVALAAVADGADDIVGRVRLNGIAGLAAAVAVTDEE